MGLIASAYVAARIARRRAEEERPTRFSSASDDEAGGFPTRSARSERSEWSNQTRIARRRAEEERPTRFSSANDDEAGGFPTRSARSERSEWSNQTPIARRRAGQAGAPLSWTSEGADTLFVCERVR